MSLPITLCPKIPRHCIKDVRFSNYCLRFNGVNQYLRIAYAPFAPVTVKFWFRPAVNDRILFGAFAVPDGLYGRFRNTNQVRITWVTTTGVYTSITSTNLAVLNQWNNLAFTLDGAAGTMTMLLNNVLMTAPYAGIPKALNPMLDFANYVGIGYFNGLLDEISLLNAVEPVSELRESYYRGYARLAAASRINLRLEEGTGLTAYDDSGFGNNGSLNPALTPPIWAPVAKYELLAEAGV